MASPKTQAAALELGALEAAQGPHLDRIGQMADPIEVLNLRYRGAVEDDAHSALSGRLRAIRDVFGTVGSHPAHALWGVSSQTSNPSAKKCLCCHLRSLPMRPRRDMCTSG